MRILGIDPGLNTTGYGVIDAEGSSLTLVEAGIVKGGRASPWRTGSARSTRGSPR